MLKKLLFVGLLFLFSNSIVFSAEVVNLNTATQAQLETLKGIGPSTAKAIIEYREQKGKFESVDELMNVKGVGSKKLSKIIERVTVVKPKEKSD